MDDSNEYERLRQENILKNQALLRKLQLDSATLIPRGKNAIGKSSASKAKRPYVKKETPVARRTSSRLAGIPADSEKAKRKSEDDAVALQTAERAKRARVAGDLSFDLKQNLIDVMKKGARFEKSFTDEDVKDTGDKDLRGLREKMMGLKIYEKHNVNDIKICPERIYHLAFHPTVDKQLVFAGDKVGNLGIFDAQSNKEDEDGEPIPDISQFKVHSRTISTFCFDPDNASMLYTSSYDGSVRKFDLATGVASEVYVGTEEDALSGVEVYDTNVIYFATLSGQVGRRDLRECKDQIWTLSEKKIGGFSLNPRAPYIAATASLDRTVKLWDLRRIKGFGREPKVPHLLCEHTSPLSVSCALWNSKGSLATTSYDNTIKIYKYPDAPKWEPGKKDLATMKPDKIIPHNNQTGRWVTILRAQWQQNPSTGSQKFVIANMNRFLDIYSENGEQLAQLGDDSITAVPAVAQFHPSQDWIAGGSGSGKLALFT